MEAFTPLTVGTTEIPNRIAVPAMVTRLSGEDGYVNDDIVERYSRFAEGGAGLIVVEASSIHGGRSGPLLKVSSDDFIPGYTELTDACHAAGSGKVFLQIIHFLKVARSGWRQKVGDLTVEELEALPDLFAAAAERALAAGFDGVEVHMAHAYTMSSMLSRMNRRRDQYGRTLENRLRLPTMVLRRVIDRVGSAPVAVRFDADESIRRGYSVEDASQMALRFADLGVAYISLSAGGKFEDAVHREGEPLYPYTGYSGDRCMPGDTYPDAANSWMASAVRATLRQAGHHTPVLGAGKVGTVELASSLIESGACDIVGMARALLADPYLPAKAAAGRHDEIVKCIYCNVCKSLDENFKTVVCYLWPKGSTQAPRWEPDSSQPPLWPVEEPLTVRVAAGEVRLSWTAAGTAQGYHVERSDGGGAFRRITACTRTSQLDDSAIAGRPLSYRVTPFDASGCCGPPSNVVDVELEQEMR